MVTTERISAVCVALQDCQTIEEWEQSFHNSFLQMTGEDAYYAHNPLMSMYRAALLFSIVSLRKVADFAESRGSKPDDIRLADFGLDLQTLTGQSEIIDRDVRDRINKGIAHLTTMMDPDFDELHALRKVLEEKEGVLRTLMDTFFAMEPSETE